MNNILTFDDYRKMNIRQVESLIYHQFIGDDSNKDINEGFIRKQINKLSGNFIKTALAEEIEKGKELEKSIHEALDSLNQGFEEIKNKISKDKNSKSKLNAIEKIKEAIKSAQSQTFDTLTMIGSEGEIDFAGFIGSSTISAAANFGILFDPIRSIFISRKAYKYFLGIIKQTIRRNLLIIQLNFDQFENLILQKSFETDDDSEVMTMRNTLHDVIQTMEEKLCKDGVLFKSKRKQKEMSNWLNDFSKTQDLLIKQGRERDKRNPLSSLWADQQNNTYTRTLEQIKQYVNDDSQKELDALKNSITKMAGNNNDLVAYGELMMSAAEEYAIKTNYGINNNFIKMSSVFNLDNQKKLIELIVETQKENEAEIKRIQDEQDSKDFQEKRDKKIEEGKKLYDTRLKDIISKKYTLDEFDDEFSNEDVSSLKAFFDTEEGKEEYKKIIDENPLFKYFIMSENTLNDFLTHMSKLKIVEISDMSDFYRDIVNEEQSLYYIMAERSIKDAVESSPSEEYFGIKEIKGNVYDKYSRLKTKVINNSDGNTLESILNSTINFSENRTSKYFLTFDNGSGEDLFNILHNEFKTEIFDADGENYKSDISIKNKESILKLIHKKLKLGNSISTQLASYLVRLEAHMLLETMTPWFVIKNNKTLFEFDCFNKNSDKIVNNKAFVEISHGDYNKINEFLTNLRLLHDNDFIIENDKK